MKRFYMYLMAGVLACSTGVSHAQGQQPAVRGALISPAFGGNRLTEVYVVGGDNNTLLYKTNVVAIDPNQLPFAQIRAFYMPTPPEYLDAQENYQDCKYREARAKFADFRNKYKAIEQLPQNYTALAAYMEVECAVRMLDWGAVKSLTAQLPRQSHTVPAKVFSNLQVYALLGKLADKNADDVISTANNMLKDAKKWNFEQKARINLALGWAMADKGDDEAKTLQALAYAIAGQHGGGFEIAGAAILKSMDVLMKDPAVDEFVKRMSATPSVSERLAAPKKVQEAAALAYLYKEVLYPNRNLAAKYSKFLPCYVTPIEREEARKAAARENEGEGAEPAPTDENATEETEQAVETAETEAEQAEEQAEQGPEQQEG